jgi:hypothetical protein
MEVVGPARVDFGDYPSWEQRVAEYRIRNAGDGPLGIVRIRETCDGCAHVICSRKQLMPGEDAVIRLTVLPNSLSGKYEKAAYVESTNSSARFVPLLFAGNAIPIVEVKPANYVYMGRIRTNEEWHQTFQLTATTNDVSLGLPLTQTGSNQVRITYRLPKNTPYRCSELIVTVLPACEPGDFNCTIKVPILSRTGHPPVEISVAGKIGSELVALPGLLYLPVSDAPVEKQFQLKILGGDKIPIDVGTLRMPECDGVRFCASPSPTADGVVVVTARFDSGFIERLHLEERISLNIGLPGVAPARLVCERGTGK